MRIDFNGPIPNEQLEGYLVEKEDRLGRIRLMYDFEGVMRNYTESIGEKLSDVGYLITRVSERELWSSDPDKFTLTVNANIYGGKRDVERVNDLWKVKDYDMYVKDFEKIGTKEGGSFFSYSTDIMREIPSATLSGKVSYEHFDDVDPRKVLEVLESEGFKSSMQTTLEQIEEIAKNSRPIIRKVIEQVSHYQSLGDVDGKAW